MRGRDLAVQGSAVLEGTATGVSDTGRDDCAALATTAEQEVVDIGAGNADAEIEPIEQRAAEPAQIAKSSTVVLLQR